MRLLLLALALSAGMASAEDAYLCVFSNTTVPVLLASSCTDNYTLPVGKDIKIEVEEEEEKMFWVVPQGHAWDCAKPCANCFYLHMKVHKIGAAKTTVGYGNAETCRGGNRTFNCTPMPDEATSRFRGENITTVNEYILSNTTQMNVTGVRVVVTKPSKEDFARANVEVKPVCSQSPCNSTVLSKPETCINAYVHMSASDPAAGGGGPLALWGWGRRGGGRRCRRHCGWWGGRWACRTSCWR